MSEMGKAMMGTGEMAGEGRALKAAEAAISNPLLDDVSMKGARAVLVNVTGGPDLMLFEVDEAVNRIRAEVDPDANILFGSALSEDMEGRVRVSVVATGIDAESMIRMADNVQRLPIRRKAIELESASTGTSPVARAHFEPIAQNAVHHQVGNLAQEMIARADMPLPEELAPPIAVVAEAEEPMILGGIEAPFANDVAEPANFRQFAPQPVERERERRGMFGIFGGRRRTARTGQTAEPTLQPARAPAQAQPLRTAQPAQVAPQYESPATNARSPDPRPQQQTPADDLFAGVAEDDRFEIPAFLRRQAKLGS
jgi:cell division protein FtsZ